MIPKTREEQFLNAIHDKSATTPTPLTRDEMLLKKIADSAQGGGGLHITLDVETDEQEQNTYSNCSHTWEQILAAYNSGTYMFLTLNRENGTSPVFQLGWVAAVGQMPVGEIQFYDSGSGWAISFDADGGIQ